mgnify:FL=1
MVTSVLWRKLGRDLWQRKGAVLSLVVVVAIGVGFFISMAGVWRDLDGARARYYTEQRLADFTLDIKRMPVTALDHVRGAPNVSDLYGRVRVAALLDLPGVEEPVSGTAISLPEKRRPVLNDVLLRSGTWFSCEDDRQAILNESFARENGLQPGDRIKVLLPDQQHDLLIIGTAMSPEFIYLMPPGGSLAPDPARFGVLYVPEDFLQRSADLDGAYN